MRKLNLTKKNYGKIEKRVVIDIKESHIKTALIEKNQNQIKVRGYNEKKTPKNKEDFLDALILSIKEYFRYNETKSIGISCPGNLTEEQVINPPRIPLKNFKLKKFLEKKFKVPVKVENNANCIAVAESKEGIGKKADINNFIVITLDNGIEGGLIIKNKLYKGQGFAGEIGNKFLENEYPDKISSERYLKKLTKEKIGRELKIVELLKLRTKEADELINQLTENMAEKISEIINLLNPDAIIFAGDFEEAGNRLLKLINIKIQKHLFIPSKTKLTWTKIKNPGIIGAGLI